MNSEAVFDQDDDGIVVLLVDDVPQPSRTTRGKPCSSALWGAEHRRVNER